MVSLLLEKPTWKSPLVVRQGIPNIEGANKFLWTVTQILEPGNDYSLTVWFSDTIKSTTAAFNAEDGKIYINCGTRGVPNKQGGCDCVGKWSGPDCSINPCDISGCNPLQSTCDELTGECLCNPGFSGLSCYIAEGCEFGCNNSGFDTVGRATPGDPCSGLECSCSNQWEGDRCDTCSLPCQNGFTPDPSCSFCACEPGSGFTNTFCECQYYIFEAKIVDPAFQFLLSDDDESSRFSSSFAWDMATSLGLNALRVRSVSMYSTSEYDEAGDGVLYVEFYGTEPCVFANSDATTSGERRRNLLAPAGGGDNMTDVNIQLNDIWMKLQAEMDEPSGPIFRGVASRHLDQGYIICKNCPEMVVATDAPAPVVQTFWQKTGWKILVAVLGTLVGLLLGYLLYRVWRHYDEKEKNVIFGGKSGVNPNVNLSSKSFNLGQDSSSSKGNVIQTPGFRTSEISLSNFVSDTSVSSPVSPIQETGDTSGSQWEEQWSEEHNVPYWVHSVTGESSWERPQGM